ncbi:MAG: hypothetical protein MUP03_10545 [Anaerolineales bacterium]|nr:hypothetical protein [Anaerolineales bacterium]
MRITRASLIRIAKETVQQRTYNDKTIIAAYLSGSLLSAEPFLGGTTDIDLVFVHKERPSFRREIVGLGSDLHLDISHQAQKDYLPLRDLRLNPWLGYEIYDPMLLFETEHFFEFTQAGLRAQFLESPIVIQRSRRLLDHGRQIWTDLEDKSRTSPNKLEKYLKSIYHGVNALAELTGPPLSERRLLLDFPARVDSLGRPGYNAGLLGLLGAANMNADLVSTWLPEWQAAYLAAAGSPRVDPRIHPARLGYYRKAFESMSGSENPGALLWPMLRTWTLAATVLPKEKNKAWQTACQHLSLTGEHFQERIQGLDQYLDSIEELLEGMAAAQGD